ncbi:F17 fimbrial protein [Pantoea alhagi]|uniref:F17 fimbrial protein n=1 Tax=Pantoea alhagi TaxID=1891675 RepID=A0A1W6B582_9GAMM|nr:fimbrial protein [Pantoea alhagi]ARJ42251.1 F17 fimbrial protein [Pantoea alhagi]
MRNIKLTLCAMALAATSASALAEGEATTAVTQGTVTFNGELISETCNIATDSRNREVQLPKISTQTLKIAGATAGSKGFDLNVTDCPQGISRVAAHFEAIGSSGVNSATGNLTNQYNGTETKARNVEVRLYNSDEQPLKLGETGQAFPVNSGNATMRYYGGYYATDATTAGRVTAQAKYTLAYP